MLQASEWSLALTSLLIGHLYKNILGTYLIYVAIIFFQQTWRYNTNAVMKICFFLCLHIRMMWPMFHISTLFTFQYIDR